MAYILHIDTSSEKSVVALSENGKILNAKESEKERNSAATINLTIEAVLLEEGLRLDDINAVSVIGGPGSYTGLRIGLSTAKGICYVLDKPLILHNKLDLLALERCSEYGDLYDYYLTVLTARVGEYFACMYNNNGEVVMAPTHIEEATLGEWTHRYSGRLLLAGVSAKTIGSLLADDNVKFVENDQVGLDFWAMCSYKSYDCNNFSDLANSEPFYLKQVYTHKKL